MALYKQKTPTVEADVWQPTDENDAVQPLGLDFFEGRPFFPDDIDEMCGRPWNEHGWFGNLVDGQVICPGDFLVTQWGETGVVHKTDFEAKWESAS